jgi:hypothetical protein
LRVREVAPNEIFNASIMISDVEFVLREFLPRKSQKAAKEFKN